MERVEGARRHATSAEQSVSTSLERCQTFFLDEEKEMTERVELSDDLMEELCREAERQGRSVPEQLKHCVRLGKAVAKSAHFSLAKVQAALSAQAPTTTLNHIEYEVWSDMFDDLLTRTTPQAEEFFAERRRLGQGSGFDENGYLVHASDQIPKQKL
jgi:hypothetical protein